MRAWIGIALVAACGPGARGPGMPDAGSSADATGASPDSAAATELVFAHTKDTLYRVDPVTLAIEKVGGFVWSDGDDTMTDLAVDFAGVMIGISYTSVYRVDVSTAVATRLSTGLAGQFNGLSFVPAAMLGMAGADVLVATRANDGHVFRIDPASGTATQIGDMYGYASSGDLVSVTDFGTVLTARNGVDPDRLVELATQTFIASPIGADIGFAEIYGVAYWKGRVFGFTGSGEFVLIDPQTGSGTLVQSGGPKWWGAAVTTAAPVLL